MTRDPVVLIVLADTQTRHITANGLRMYGYDVVPALSGTEAAELIRSGTRIDVVVTDAELGGEVDGLAVATLAKRLLGRVDVIYVSRNPAKIPQARKVTGAPCIRMPYQAQQIAGLITALRCRMPSDEVRARVA